MNKIKSKRGKDGPRSEIERGSIRRAFETWRKKRCNREESKREQRPWLPEEPRTLPEGPASSPMALPSSTPSLALSSSEFDLDFLVGLRWYWLRGSAHSAYAFCFCLSPERSKAHFVMGQLQFKPAFWAWN